MNLEEHNLMEIEGLSQRGRTLSIIDLISANTLSVDMAAYSLLAMANGASFLTAARPGNAGKTTLMACLLTFLPPGVRIVTVSNPGVIAEAQRYINSAGQDRLCFLCHEIGNGPWYGYLWDKYVGQMLSLMKSGCRVASCIHADTLPEMQNIMVSRELGVSAEDFASLDMILFMHLERGNSYRRRVAAFYERGYGNQNHNLLFTWERNSDTFAQQGESILLKRISEKSERTLEQVSQEFKDCQSFIEKLMASGNTDFRWVRKQVVGFYSSGYRTSSIIH